MGGHGSKKSAVRVSVLSELVVNIQSKTHEGKGSRLTRAYPVGRSPQTAAVVRQSRHNDAVTGVTLRSIEVAAGAGYIAGEVGAISGFGRG